MLFRLTDSRRVFRDFALLVALASLPSAGVAGEPAKTKTPAASVSKVLRPAVAERPGAEFEARLAALKKTHGVVAIKMKAADDPSAPSEPSSGVVLVSTQRSGIYTPPLLSSEDMLGVLQAQMATIRGCYKAQLLVDPRFSDEAILDVSVKKTGRVSEVSVSPGRVERSPLGKCLLSEVPKWNFPQFTGELEDGVTQEVVNASFPLAFSQAD